MLFHPPIRRRSIGSLYESENPGRRVDTSPPRNSDGPQGAPPEADETEQPHPYTQQVVSRLEVKWDAQINALQTTGSLNIQEIETEMLAAAHGAARALAIEDLKTEMLVANKSAAQALDVSEVETKKLKTSPPASYRSTFPMALEQHRTKGVHEAIVHGAIRIDELPVPVRSAVIEASKSYSGQRPIEIPSEVEFDEFLSTLQHTAQLTVPQRIALVEFAYGTRAAVHAMPYFIQGAISQLPTVELPSVARVAESRRIAATYQQATIAVLSLFVILQVVLILRQQTGPFQDEAIYIFAGMRTIEGFGLADNYLTWFAGSLLWPLIAASGYLIAGLVGARLIALACTTLAIGATSKAARNLFGEPAQFWTALTLAISGPVIYLAHLAVYDQLALAGIAVSFWAVSQVGKGNDRRWLIIAALSFAIAVIAKYPMILCLAPLVGVLYVVRRQRAQVDLFIMLFASLALLLVYALPLRDQLAAFLVWRQENNPSFGATTAMIRFSLLWYGGVAWLLALLGAAVAWFARKGKRLLIVMLIGGLFLWPAYHFIINNSISAEKHQVFGFLFGYPLVGALCAAIWLRRGSWRWVRRALLAIVLLGMAIAGYAQAQQMDQGWADTRPAAQYLETHVQPGERILASDGAPYQMALYRNGNLRSPWDIYDTYRVAHGEFAGNLCTADWFVDEQGGIGWSDSVHEKIMACGTFKEVFTSTTTVTQLGRTLTFVTYPVHTVVWVNLAYH